MNKKTQHIIQPIGIIHSPYKTKEECPIQGCAKPEGKGRIEVFPEYEEGLLDIEMFSHLILLYHFDRADETTLVRYPFMDDAPHGIFAMRHPFRPNKIGLSIVKLEGRNKNIIDVSRIDILDGSPLIDIKPYAPKFDHIDNASEGWLDGKKLRPKPEGRE